LPQGFEFSLPDGLPECLLVMTGFRSGYSLEIAASIAQIFVDSPEKFACGQ
jgi:hypothetical protein